MEYPENKWQIARPRYRRKDNTELHLTETAYCEDVDQRK